MAAVDILTLAFFKLWERNLIPYQERIQFPGLVSGHMALGISFLVFTLLAYLFDARKGWVPADHGPLDASAPDVLRQGDLWPDYPLRSVL